MFKRQCPQCLKELLHKSETYGKWAKKKNKPCLNCSAQNSCKKRDLTPYRTPEFRAKISKYSAGKNNPMSGVSVYDIWVKKYGEKIADEKMTACRAKHSFNNKGKKNGMYGKPSPGGSGYGWKGWYNGWFFRSLRELSYMVNVIEPNNHIWISAENNKYRIEYQDLLGNNRTYCADFIIDNKLMIEIKPKRLHKTKLIQAKAKAARTFCRLNNLKYKLLDVKILTSEQIKELYDGKQIKFTDRYEQKYQETYCS